MRENTAIPASSPKAKVLLVEDNRVSRLVAERLLSRWGYAVSAAADGLEALKLAALSEYDLILMNLNMPRLDGAATVRLIRRLSNHYSRIPIISLSASKQRVQGGIFTDYLEKPYMPEQLQNLLQQYLQEPATPSLRHHLDERLQKLSGQDAVFRRQLVGLFVKNCEELLQDLNSGRLDEPHFLAKVAHKHKSSLRLLELFPLEAALENLQEVLSLQEADASLLQRRKGVVEQLTQSVLEQLGAVAA